MSGASRSAVAVSMKRGSLFRLSPPEKCVLSDAGVQVAPRAGVVAISDWLVAVCTRFFNVIAAAV